LWLVVSILQLLLCWNVFAIVPLVFAMQAEQARATGDTDTFERKLAAARRGSHITIGMSVLFWLGSSVFFLLAAGHRTDS
jgi:hypothetical protein